MTATAPHPTSNGKAPTSNGHRPPPHSIEAEQAVLGAAMAAPAASGWLVQHLGVGDFYRPAHRAVATAVLELAADGLPVDPVTVQGVLQRHGALAEVGGAPFLHTLYAAFPTAAHVGYYGRQVLAHARLRRLIDAGHRIATLGVQDDIDPDRAIGAAQGWLLELAGDRTRALAAGPDDLLDAVAELRDAEAAGRTITWGLRDLDRITGGLGPGQLILVAARTSVGKSSLAIQVAAHAAERARALVCSYEMTRAEVAQHILAKLSPHSLASVKAFCDADGLAPVRNAFRLLDLQVYDHNPDVDTLCAQLQALHATRPLGLVVVDYLQKIRVTGLPRGASREQEIAAITSRLKDLAKQLSCPVLACAQLNRAATSRPPELHDLRESGSQEMDADVVVLLHRPDEQRPVVTARVAKQRMGPQDTATLAWRPDRAMFADLTHRLETPA